MSPSDANSSAGAVGQDGNDSAAGSSATATSGGPIAGGPSGTGTPTTMMPKNEIDDITNPAVGWGAPQQAPEHQTPKTEQVDTMNQSHMVPQMPSVSGPDAGITDFKPFNQVSYLF